MPGIKKDLNEIAPEMPPRHHEDNALCMQAALHGNCPLSHEYHGGALTDAEARWLYVERMLEELARLEPDSGREEAGWHFDVDDVHRNSNGAIVTIFGTRLRFEPDSQVPYTFPFILGEV